MVDQALVEKFVTQVKGMDNAEVIGELEKYTKQNKYASHEGELRILRDELAMRMEYGAGALMDLREREASK